MSTNNDIIMRQLLMWLPNNYNTFVQLSKNITYKFYNHMLISKVLMC